MASMDGSAVKNLPAMQEMLVQSLGQDDPLSVADMSKFQIEF